MKYVVSLSGGIGSFVAAAIVLHKKGRRNVELVFADTRIEDEDLYRFLVDIVRVLKCPFVWLQDGRTPWEVFRDVEYQGNSRIAPCSRVLKTDQVRTYLEARYAPGEAVVVLGIDWSEAHRVTRAAKAWEPYQVWAPLCDPPYLSGEDRKQFMHNLGIEVPRLYKHGFPHNNCGGFCVRAGQAQFKRLWEEFPERYEWHSQQQQQLARDVPNADRPFLRKTIGGELNYLSLEEFKAYMNLRGEDKFDYGGCGCFVDEETTDDS